MSNRPDYIKCVQHTNLLPHQQKTSWCQKKLTSFDWVFQNLDHALYTRMNNDRFLICPECKAEIQLALNL